MAAEPLSYEEILTSKLPRPIHDEHGADRAQEEIQVLGVEV